jgi:hypothetical protein
MIRDSPNLEDQVTVFVSPRSRVAQYYPQALGSLFVASYDSQGYGGAARDPQYIASGRSPQKTSFYNNCSILIGMCLPPRCIETAVLLLRACWNLFTESLSNNERLFWLRYSGFQASCHSTVQTLSLLYRKNSRIQ